MESLGILLKESQVNKNRDCYNCNILIKRIYTGLFGKTICPPGYPLPDMSCWEPVKENENIVKGEKSAE